MEAQPVLATFPADAVPDLSGLTFDITGPVASEDTESDGVTATCETGTADSSTGDASCPESDGGDPPSGPDFLPGSWIAGDQYAIALDTASGSAPAPPNTLIPQVTGAFPDCTAYQSSSPTPPSGCPDTVPVEAYGTYHQVGLHVTSSVTAAPVVNAKYELCSATASPPVTSLTGCPSGSSVLTTAKTDASGTLVFPGLYLGSQNYSVALMHRPHGYHWRHRSRQLKVPVVTTSAEAGTLVQRGTSLTPIMTKVKKQHVTTSENKAVTLNAVAGAKHRVGPLTLVSVSTPSDGTAHHVGNTVTYTPSHGFVGHDVFTYTVRNGVGVESTGEVVVHVKA